MTTQRVSLADDAFIHFTYIERAKQIMLTRKLLVDPPYEHFGIAGVQAVSVNHGAFIPGVQLDHLRENDDLKQVVVIVFRTDTRPKYGYIEEVIWNTDVNLIDAKIISIKSAISLLDNKTQLADGDMLMYESILVRYRGNYKL